MIISTLGSPSYDSPAPLLLDPTQGWQRGGVRVGERKPPIIKWWSDGWKSCDKYLGTHAARKFKLGV